MADEPTEETPEDEEGTDETSEQPTEDKGRETPDPEPEIPPALRAVLNKERRAAREAEKRAKAAESKLSKIEATNMTEHERAVKAAREAGLSDGVKTGNSRLLRAEVIASAAGKFVDPDEAFVLLKDRGVIDELVVSDEGDVDTDAIKAALDDLIKAKPHLGVRRGPTPGQRSPAQLAPDSTSKQFDSWIRDQIRK
jgi:hypothetical protein